jgi:GT2 family glycosyltransferase
MRAVLVVINYNTRNDLRACLLSAEEKLPDYPVVVVDNGSHDGSQEMVERDFPRARLVRNRGNLGYASACNLGIKVTSEPYVFILNSDVEFPGNGLEEILEFMDRHPEVGALGPLVLNPDGSRQMSCRRFPSLLESVVHGFLGELWPDNPLTRKYQLKDLPADRPREVDWVSGAAMLLRREAVENVGGFDERYFMYVEDVDLCWRLRHAGYRVYFHPGFRVVHKVGRSSSQQSLRMLWEHHRSMLVFFRRRYRGWKGALAAVPVYLGVLARFAITAASRVLRAEGRED